MGTEAFWIPALISAATAATAGGVSMYNTNKTLHRQDQQAAQGIRQQSKRQQEANAKVNELIQKTKGSNAEGDKTAALQQYMQQLGVSRGGAEAGLGDVSGASGAFANATNDARSGVADYGSQVAGLMSRIDAPMRQRDRENDWRNNFSSDIERIKRFSAGDDFLNKLKLNKIQRNPWLDVASSVIGAAGSGLASGYSGGSAGAMVTGAPGTTYTGMSSPTFGGYNGAKIQM
jgi:TolA-binding protein